MFRVLATAYFFSVAFCIYGGEDATIDQFPHQVHIRHFNRSICGGAIVNKNTILTAAHCTNDLSAKYMSIRAGSDSKLKGGQIRTIAQIIQHEKYNALINDYDISVLKLSEPLQFGSRIKAIELQGNQIEVRTGTEAVISGWGATVLKGKHKTVPDTLRKVTVTVISMKECKDQYTQNPVTERMFCATAEGGKDSCKGDSGGPLVANNKLIGLVSWGRGCGKAKFPGVYTKISELRPWIDKQSAAPVPPPAA